jgi:Fe-S cluster biogenesis protein NfuA
MISLRHSDLIQQGDAIMTMPPTGTEPAGDFGQRVSAALNRIRPALQADGGDIELLGIEGRDARVRLVGACHG